MEHNTAGQLSLAKSIDGFFELRIIYDLVGVCSKMSGEFLLEKCQVLLRPDEFVDVA